jgi:hypothetical protein
MATSHTGSTPRTAGEAIDELNIYELNTGDAFKLPAFPGFFPIPSGDVYPLSNFVSLVFASDCGDSTTVRY